MLEKLTLRKEYAIRKVIKSGQKLEDYKSPRYLRVGQFQMVRFLVAGYPVTVDLPSEAETLAYLESRVDLAYEAGRFEEAFEWEEKVKLFYM